MLCDLLHKKTEHNLIGARTTTILDWTINYLSTTTTIIWILGTLGTVQHINRIACHSIYRPFGGAASAGTLFNYDVYNLHTRM